MTVLLKSYIADTWIAGEAPLSKLYDPSTEAVVAETSTRGVDFSAAFAHARAVGGPALRALSFAESSFFPIPPDVMLAPMTLARPDAATRFALLTTVTSVAGGLAGYAIGYFAMDLAEPWMREAGYWEGYTEVREWFVVWGFWAVLAAGFSPIQATRNSLETGL